MQIPLPPPRRSWVFCIHNGSKNFERILIQLCKAVTAGSRQQCIRNLFYINRGPQSQLNDLSVKNCEKAVELRTYDFYKCGLYCQHNE